MAIILSRRYVTDRLRQPAMVELRSDSFLDRPMLITMINNDYTPARETTMPKTETRVLTAHVPVVLAEKVDQLADRLERSRGWIMKQALMTWIAQEEDRDRLTQEALADVDIAHVIDHHAVQLWADSLSTNEPLPAPR